MRMIKLVLDRFTRLPTLKVHLRSRQRESGILGLHLVAEQCGLPRSDWMSSGKLHLKRILPSRALRMRSAMSRPCVLHEAVVGA